MNPTTTRFARGKFVAKGAITRTHADPALFQAKRAEWATSGFNY